LEESLVVVVAVELEDEPESPELELSPEPVSEEVELFPEPVSEEVELFPDEFAEEVELFPDEFAEQLLRFFVDRLLNGTTAGATCARPEEGEERERES
jgi:hypothetical protein